MHFQKLHKAAFYNTFCILIISALMFFITQGNSMFVTDLFAKKVVELIDCETPPPAEERSDSGNTNNMNEEYHYEIPLYQFLSVCCAEANFQYEKSALYSVLKQRVLTPPPEFS